MPSSLVVVIGWNTGSVVICWSSVVVVMSLVAVVIIVVGNVFGKDDNIEVNLVEVVVGSKKGEDVFNFLLNEDNTHSISEFFLRNLPDLNPYMSNTIGVL